MNDKKIGCVQHDCQECKARELQAAELRRLEAANAKLLEVLKGCRFALEPYDDLKPRDWKTDRERLAVTHRSVVAAVEKHGGKA